MLVVFLFVVANAALVATPLIGVYTNYSPVIPLIIFIIGYILLYIKTAHNEYKH